jgi:hypothetical protein
MIEITDRTARMRRIAHRHWLFETGYYSRPRLTTFVDEHENLKLKRVLKRAVMREFAPQSLIDSIKNEIGK